MHIVVSYLNSSHHLIVEELYDLLVINKKEIGCKLKQLEFFLDHLVTAYENILYFGSMFLMNIQWISSS